MKGEPEHDRTLVFFGPEPTGGTPNALPTILLLNVTGLVFLVVVLTSSLFYIVLAAIVLSVAAIVHVDRHIDTQRGRMDGAGLHRDGRSWFWDELHEPLLDESPPQGFGEARILFHHRSENLQLRFTSVEDAQYVWERFQSYQRRGSGLAGDVPDALRAVNLHQPPVEGG